MRRASSRSPGDGLRVVMVSESYDVWGAERSLLSLAPLLDRHGVTPILLAPSRSLLTAQWREKGLEWHAVDLPIHRGIRSSLDSSRTASARPSRPLIRLTRESSVVARSSVRLSRAIGRVGADVVHSNSLWGHVETVLAGRLTGVPVVLELHDLVAPGLGRRLLGLATRAASASVAISRAVAACAGTGWDQRVEVIPQAVDVSRFHPAPANRALRASLCVRPDEPLVGIVGRLDPEKGVHVLVEAMAQLDGTLARTGLAVVGRAFRDPSYADWLRRHAMSLLGDRVRFIEPMEDVASLYRCFDVLVSASYAEPFGLTILEAQASGVPVVATEGGGVGEFVDRDTGLLVPPGDAVALATALERMLTSADLRSHVVSSARARVEATYDLSRRAEAFAYVYRQVSG